MSFIFFPSWFWQWYMFLMGNRKYNTPGIPNLTVLLGFVARFPYIPGCSQQDSFAASRREPPLCLNWGEAELFFQSVNGRKFSKLIFTSLLLCILSPSFGGLLRKKKISFWKAQEFRQLSIFPTSNNSVVRIYYPLCLSVFQGNIFHSC